MLIDHITTETVTKGRIFSEDGTTTDNGSAMVAHASVGTYGTDGAITPTSASGFGGGNQSRYTFDVRNTLPDGVYQLALFRDTPVIGAAFKLLPFRVYAGNLIPIQGGENVTITSRSVSPTPYSRQQVDDKLSGEGVSSALQNAVNEPGGLAALNDNGDFVGNWIPTDGTAAELDELVGPEGMVAVSTDTNEIRRFDGTTPGGVQLLGANLSAAVLVKADGTSSHSYAASEDSDSARIAAIEAAITAAESGDTVVINCDAAGDTNLFKAGIRLINYGRISNPSNPIINCNAAGRFDLLNFGHLYSSSTYAVGVTHASALLFIGGPTPNSATALASTSARAMGVVGSSASTNAITLTGGAAYVTGNYFVGSSNTFNIGSGCTLYFGPLAGVNPAQSIYTGSGTLQRQSNTLCAEVIGDSFLAIISATSGFEFRESSDHFVRRLSEDLAKTDTTLASLFSTVPLKGLCNYKFRAWLPFTASATGGLKLSFTDTAENVTGLLSLTTYSSGGASLSGPTAVGSPYEVTGPTAGYAVLEGVLSVSNFDDTTLQMQFAQSVDDGTSTILANATMELVQIEFSL